MIDPDQMSDIQVPDDERQLEYEEIKTQDTNTRYEIELQNTQKRRNELLLQHTSYLIDLIIKYEGWLKDYFTVYLNVIYPRYDIPEQNKEPVRFYIGKQEQL